MGDGARLRRGQRLDSLRKLSGSLAILVTLMKTSTRTAIVAVALSLAVLLSLGCDSKSRGSGVKDVKNDPAFGDFTSVVGMWKTKTPLRLVEIEFRGDKILCLVNGDASIHRSHLELPEVPAGSEVRIEHLIFTSTPVTELLDVTGSLATGPYSGKIVRFDKSLFAPGLVDHYCLWHVDPTKPKPKWTVAPEKLERVVPVSGTTAPAQADR